MPSGLRRWGVAIWSKRLAIIGTCSVQAASCHSKLASGRGPVLAAPEHPGGEDAVEERLHERGAEEVLALLALELHAEGFFQSLPQAFQGGQVGGLLDAGAGLAGIRGEKPREVLRVGQRRGVEHDAAEELDEPLAMLLCGLVRVGEHPEECVLALGQAVGFEADGLARSSRPIRTKSR